jgi:predicted NAD-dependent protein-ADP-ribosyltransferase YbiA (DUF1768 family)
VDPIHEERGGAEYVTASALRSEVVPQRNVSEIPARRIPILTKKNVGDVVQKRDEHRWRKERRQVTRNGYGHPEP